MGVSRNASINSHKSMLWGVQTVINKFQLQNCNSSCLQQQAKDTSSISYSYTSDRMGN